MDHTKKLKMSLMSNNEKVFWNEFLNLYRSLPYLWWDNAEILAIENRENYRTNTAKAKERLLLYVRQRYPNADMPFVQRKIHNFRCGFHREYRKKQKLEALGQEHRPVLWYYKKLLFLVDEEDAMDLIDEDTLPNSTIRNRKKRSLPKKEFVAKPSTTTTTTATTATTNTTTTTTDAPTENNISEIIDIKQEITDNTDINIKHEAEQQEAENEESNENAFIEIIEQPFTDDDNELVDIYFEPEVITLTPIKKLIKEQVTSSNTKQLNHNSTPIPSNTKKPNHNSTPIPSNTKHLSQNSTPIPSNTKQLNHNSTPTHSNIKQVSHNPTSTPITTAMKISQTFKRKSNQLEKEKANNTFALNTDMIARNLDTSVANINPMNSDTIPVNPDTIPENPDTIPVNRNTIPGKRKKVKLNDIFTLVDRAVTQAELQAKEDIFDVIGRKIAHDFRDMNRSQRIFADKIINDVIYYGKANRLRSTFSFTPSN